MDSDPTPPEAPRETPLENTMSDARAAIDKAGFSSGEGMVALGGLILLGSWVLFDFFMNWRSFMGHLAMAAAFVVVVLHFGRGSWTSAIAPKAVLIKALGYVIAFMGLITLLYAIRYTGTINEAEEIIPFLVYMAGYALAFLGARQIAA
jgi:hypothetical protein